VVIQGAGQDVTTIDGGGNGSVVTANSVNSAATLEGFTITNGNGTNGGGMYNFLYSSPTVTNCTFSGNTATSFGGGMSNFLHSSPTVTNCTFSGNTAGDSGGGMYNDNSSSTVTNCTFKGNTVTNINGSGGGMHNNNSSPTVTNCTFKGNTVTNINGSGGGMYNDFSSPTVTNCTFTGNTATVANGFGGGMHNNHSSSAVTNCTFSGNNAGDSGGGMYNIYSSPTVTNCTFKGNTADFFGGGMHNDDHSSPAVTNCTFSGNSAYKGGGMSNLLSSSPTLTNSILWGDDPEEFYNVSATPSVTYSDIQKGYTGTGNINADPMFVDEGNGDLHLKPFSPCIDAGDNSAPSLPTTDFDGNNRTVDDPTVVDTGNGTPPIVDMGAYEVQKQLDVEFPWELFYPAFIHKKKANIQ
jgi:hypothetical protein